MKHTVTEQQDIAIQSTRPPMQLIGPLAAMLALDIQQSVQQFLRLKLRVQFENCIDIIGLLDATPGRSPVKTGMCDVRNAWQCGNTGNGMLKRGWHIA